MQLFSRKRPILKATSTLVVLLAFLVNFALSPSIGYAGLLGLPSPGTMVPLSSGFIPTILRGIRIHPDNPFEFDFIVDNGNSGLEGDELKKEGEKIIRYFLASMTLPEKDVWVNLSPYEKDRIVSDSLGFTEMGRDMLAQDYLLKQVTASLIYPENDLGKEFWDRVYEKAYLEHGTTNIPMNTFNKVWIIPEEATVFEEGDTAYVVESKLKVMLEEDYLAMTQGKKHKAAGKEATSSISSEIVREIIIPEIEKEVNEGKNFSALRQITNSWILATWFKKNFKKSLLGRVYSDQSKVEGIDIEDKEVSKKIYGRYLQAFKKGVCDYIKIDYDKYSKKHVPRKYFSGGVVLASSAIKSYERGSDAVIPEKAQQGLTTFTRRAERAISRGGMFILTGVMLVAGSIAPKFSLAKDGGEAASKKVVPSGITYPNEYGADQHMPGLLNMPGLPVAEGGSGDAPANPPVGETGKHDYLENLGGQHGMIESKFKGVVTEGSRSFYTFENTSIKTGASLGETHFRVTVRGGQPFLEYTVYSGEESNNYYNNSAKKWSRAGRGEVTDRIELKGEAQDEGRFLKIREEAQAVVDHAYNFGVGADVAPTTLGNLVALAYRNIQQRIWEIIKDAGDLFEGKKSYSLDVDSSGRVSISTEGLSSDKEVYEKPTNYEVTYNPQQDQSVTLRVVQIDVSGTIDSKELQQEFNALTFMVENGGEQDLYLIGLSGGNNAELENLDFMSKQNALKTIEEMGSRYDKGNGNTLYIEKTLDVQKKTREKKEELEALGKEVKVEASAISDYQQDSDEIGDQRLTEDEYVNGATREGGYTLEGGIYKKVVQGWKDLGVKNVNNFHVETEGEVSPLKDLMEKEGGQIFIPVKADLSNLVKVVEESQKEEVLSIQVPATVNKEKVSVYVVNKEGGILENLVVNGANQKLNENQVSYDTTGFNDGFVYLDQTLDQTNLIFSDSLNVKLTGAEEVTVKMIPRIKKHDLQAQQGEKIVGVDVSTSMTGSTLRKILKVTKEISSEGSYVQYVSDEVKAEGEIGGNTNLPLLATDVFDKALEKGDQGEVVDVIFISDVNSNEGDLSRYLLSKRPGSSMSRAEEFIEQGHRLTLVTKDETRQRMEFALKKQGAEGKVPSPSDVLKQDMSVVGNRNWHMIMAYLVELTRENGSKIISSGRLEGAVEKLSESHLRTGEFEISEDFDVQFVEVKWTDQDGATHTRRLTVQKTPGHAKDFKNVKEITGGEFEKLEIKKAEAKKPSVEENSSGDKTFFVDPKNINDAYSAEQQRISDQANKAINPTPNEIKAGIEKAVNKALGGSSKASPTGGIDLDAEELELKIKGSGIDFTLPENLKNLDPSQIPGLIPTIINIVPITNISNLWDESSPEPLAYLD
ncbi:MAG: hypothetical protein P9M07_06045 [Candidatus Aceula meridiana]|nr:hypothetical protein [Candidatus Aceula meridiana]